MPFPITEEHYAVQCQDCHYWGPIGASEAEAINNHNSMRRPNPETQAPVDAVPVATLSELEAELREEAKAYWKDGDLVGRDIVHRCADRLSAVVEEVRGKK